MTDKTPYIYMFVREDMSHPQQIIQTAHAVDELSKTGIKNGAHMVLFGARDERELVDASCYLEAHGIKHHMFFEPDMMAHTSIATEPLIGNQRQPLKRFRTKR